ncbi:unnamed protein product [Closterium sp. NIES-65]|nr:unnamed protein product [Closterium sp. NIES-65]
MLLSSTLPGAEAAFSVEAAKQRAVKSALAFVKAVQLLLFPPPTPAASMATGQDKAFAAAAPHGDFERSNILAWAQSKPSQFRLTTAGSLTPPVNVSLGVKAPVVLASLGSNMQCSQVAPSVWDCFGQTKLTQANINSIGFTAGVGVRVDSHALRLTYLDSNRQPLVTRSRSALKRAKSTLKRDQLFGKPELLVGVPAGRFQAMINGDAFKGGAMFAVSKTNGNCKLYVSILLLYRGDLKPAATLSVFNMTSSETTSIPLDCTWTQPRPGVQLCEWLNDFPANASPTSTPAPNADNAADSAPSAAPSAIYAAPNAATTSTPNPASDSALKAAMSMRAVALPHPLDKWTGPIGNLVVNSTFTVLVESEEGDTAEAMLRYAQ